MHIKRNPRSRHQICLIFVLLCLFALLLSVPILIVCFIRWSKGSASIYADGLVGFQGNPHTRGTMTIIFMCISTLILSSQTIYHGDVPLETGECHGSSGISEVEGGSCSGGTAIITNNISISLAHRILVANLNFLMPELILFRAVKERQRASAVSHRMREKGYPKWNLMLGFFLSMNGFCNGEALLTESSLITHLRYSEECGSKVDWDEVIERIRVRDQSNCLLKGIALFQILFVTTTTFARWIQAFPITPLEVITCAQCFCATATYIVWSGKPFNVREPVDLRFVCVGPASPSHDPDIAPVTPSISRVPSARLSGKEKPRVMEYQRQGADKTDSSCYGEYLKSSHSYYF